MNRYLYKNHEGNVKASQTATQVKVVRVSSSKNEGGAFGVGSTRRSGNR